MAQVLFPAQVLHAANQSRLYPLCRRALHALWRRPSVLLDALPKSVADRAARIDEGRSHVAARRPISHQRKGRLPGLTLDAEQIVFVDRVSRELWAVLNVGAAALFDLAAYRQKT
ncbi:hypothetical protein [Mesorhizobium sp. 113-1-2]|uniref:hypothetical protein n=1 Tax=Mesorhizobium sp. 113-1-2 TaxID=2744515 RepID=UPI0019284E12|nr:hypothetical protein [Mesorhizobium sp. 113-1-2]